VICTSSILSQRLVHAVKSIWFCKAAGCVLEMAPDPDKPLELRAVRSIRQVELGACKSGVVYGDAIDVAVKGGRWED